MSGNTPASPSSSILSSYSRFVLGTCDQYVSRLWSVRGLRRLTSHTGKIALIRPGSSRMVSWTPARIILTAHVSLPNVVRMGCIRMTIFVFLQPMLPRAVSGACVPRYPSPDRLFLQVMDEMMWMCLIMSNFSAGGQPCARRCRIVRVRVASIPVTAGMRPRILATQKSKIRRGRQATPMQAARRSCPWHDLTS